jgi:putative endonuclease
MNTRALGDVAEDIAVSYLRSQGYRILERNVRTPEGEIDIVALDGDTVAFIEVKMRSTHRYGSAVSAVDALSMGPQSCFATLFKVPRCR